MKAKWITDEVFANLSSRDVLSKKFVQTIRKDIHANSHVLFRKKFSVKKGQDKFLLKITADDCFKLYVNGMFVLTGPSPSYNFHYLYNEIDIAKYLVDGENVIAVHTYYQGLINRVWVSGDDRHGLWLELYKNDEKILVSDNSFLTKRHSGYSTHGEIYGWITQFPEDYDSRSDEDRFYLNSFDDSSWHFASIKENAVYELYAQSISNMIYYDVSPKILTEENGIIFADFGQEVVGSLIIEAQGNNGDKIVIHQAEEIENERVRYNLRCNCSYEEFWILSGKSDRLIQFEYKGFRYVEIILPCGVRVTSIKANVRHRAFNYLGSQIEPTGEKERKVFDLCKNTLKYGVLDCIVDCPTREKGQYFGDGCYITLSYFVCTNDLSPMRLLIDNALLTCKVEPTMLCYGPASRVDEIAEFPLMIVTLALCEAFLSNSVDYLRTKYDDILELMSLWKRKYARENGLIVVNDKWNVVDWPESARDGYDANIKLGEKTDCHAVLNCYYLLAVKSINVMAKLLNKQQPFNYKLLKENIYNNFFNKETKLFVDRFESQHSSIGTNAFFLLLGLCENDTQEKILAMIKEKKLNCVNLFLSPIVLTSLFKAKKYEQLNELILDSNYWLNMIKEGATVTFEAFAKDKKYNTSLFHPALAFPLVFMAKDKYGESGGVLKSIIEKFEQYDS